MAFKRPAIDESLKEYCSTAVTTSSLQKWCLTSENDQGELILKPTCPVCQDKLVPFATVEIGQNFLVCPRSVLILYKDGKPSLRSSGRLHSFAHCRVLLNTNMLNMPIGVRLSNKKFEFYSYQYCGRYAHARDECELVRRMKPSPRWAGFTATETGKKFETAVEKLRNLYKAWQDLENQIRPDSDAAAIAELEKAKMEYMILDDNMQTAVNKFQQLDYENFRQTAATAWASSDEEPKRRKLARPTMKTSGDSHMCMQIQKTNASSVLSVVKGDRSILFGRFTQTCATYNCSCLTVLGALSQNATLLFNAAIPNGTKILPDDAINKPSMTNNCLPLEIVREYQIESNINPFEAALISLISVRKERERLEFGRTDELEPSAAATNYEQDTMFDF